MVYQHVLDPYDCSFESSPNVMTTCNFTINGALNRWSLHTGRTDTRDTGPYNDHTYGTFLLEFFITGQCLLTH